MPDIRPAATFISPEVAQEFSDLLTQGAAIRKRQQEIAVQLEIALPAFHDFCVEQQIPFDVPCGFEYESPRHGGPSGPQRVWRYAGFSGGMVAFTHDCEDHTRYAQDDKEIWVPLVGLTDPQAWLFLRALNPDLEPHGCN